MKKKIINGFLMVALLAATVTSFVSCKDNDEDVKTDLIAQLQKQSTDLTAAYIAADNALSTALTTAYQNADAQLKTDLQNWVEAKKYATEAWVEAKGYATESWVEAKGYATESWVEAQNYLKKSEFAETLYADPKFAGVLTTLYGEDGESGLAKDVAGLLDKVNDTENGIDALNNNVEELSNDLTALEKRIEKVEEDIAKITKDFENLITSVNVNATSTTLLANSKIFPGLNVQFVGAAFGKAITPTGEFPVADETLAEDYINITEGETYEWTGGIINNDENNAGKVYFTVNPSNILENVLNNTVKLSLTTSQNNEEIVTLDNVKASDAYLTWGTTRGDSKVTLWEADATYDVSEANAIDPAKMINFSAIGTSFKNIINAAKDIDVTGNNTKSTTKAAAKTVLKETAQAVANLVNAKIPALPALALKAEWTDNTVGTRNVISDYSLAATAYQPLSFAFGDIEGEALPNISLNKIDNAVYKIAKRITDKLNGLRTQIAGTNLDFSIDLSKLDIKKFNVEEKIYIIVETDKTTIGTDDVVTIKRIYYSQDENDIAEADEITTGTTFAANKKYYNELTVGADLQEEIKTIKTAVENGVNVKDIKDLLAEAVKMINQANKAVNKVKTLADRATDYLEAYANRAINFINNGGIKRALEPILLVDTENGITRATGSYNAGEYTFVPTTVTYEIIAPAFKKYVAVIGADGKAREGKVLTKGERNFSAVKLNLQAGDTKVVYAAMDFTGAQVVKVYDITVE